MKRRAIWRGMILAEAKETLRVEGNYDLPPDTVPDAAWYYPRPWPLARRLTCHVAFGGAVEIGE